MATNQRVNKDQSGKRKPWQFMNKFVVTKSDGDPYLIRWRIIQTPFFSLYLHKFLAGDSDPYVHDHPWTFLSIILRGGYTEVRRNNHTRRLHKRHIRHVNLMRRDDAHYIERLDRVPSWSLLFVGRRRRTWGFYVPQGIEEIFVEFENWEDWKFQEDLKV
jgi:hypothetical protein